jgi:hypothetical protein
MKAYQQSGMLKIGGVTKYLGELLQGEGGLDQNAKIIVFAVHRVGGYPKVCSLCFWEREERAHRGRGGCRR